MMKLNKIKDATYRAIELDNISIEKRNTDSTENVDPKYVVRGYAALYEKPSDSASWYTEVIKRGAFTEAVNVSDIRALLNHDHNEILARQKPGRSNNTLKVWDDEKGLGFEFEMPSTRTTLIESIERGDIDQNSFAFIVRDETWTDEREGEETKTTREIEKVDRIYDISLVTYPFYEETSFTMEQRSYDEWKAGQGETEEKDNKESFDYKTAKARIKLDQHRS